MTDPTLWCAAVPSVLAEVGIRPFWHFAGTFHPVVVHFPIALITVAALVEAFVVLRTRRATAGPSQTALTCLWIGVASAVAAAVLGWANVNAQGGTTRDDSSLLTMHRWLGIALVGLGLLTVVASALARQRPSARRVVSYRGGLILSASLVGAVGMYGGKITHGSDHYDNAVDVLLAELRAPAAAAVARSPAPQSESSLVDGTHPRPAALAPPSTPATAPTAAPKPAADAATPAATAGHTLAGAAGASDAAASPAAGERVTFARHVKPILDARCGTCHSGGKHKGGYRMDDRAHALTPGDSGEPLIVEGRSDQSLFVQLLEGRGEFADRRMPTKGPPLTHDQIAVIRRWIDEGTN